MAILHLRKTLSGSFVPTDEPSIEAAKKFKVGDVYKAEIIKPRSYKSHCLCMALLNLTFNNQDRYDNFEHFRKAVAIAAGHVDELITIDGEILLQPKSLSFSSLDEVEFTRVFSEMMAVCTKLLCNIGAEELAAEVGKYAAQHYGVAA